MLLYIFLSHVTERFAYLSSQLISRTPTSYCCVLSAYTQAQQPRTAYTKQRSPAPTITLKPYITTFTNDVLLDPLYNETGPDSQDGWAGSPRV